VKEFSESVNIQQKI